LSGSLSDRLADYAEVIKQQLLHSRLVLQSGSDFTRFCKIVKKLPQKSNISPIFDPAFGYVNRDNAFWLTVHTLSGEVISTQALILVDLDDDTMARHLAGKLHDYRPYGDRLLAQGSQLNLSTAGRLTGKTCYHGEMWLKGGPEGYRGGALVGLLPRLGMALAFCRWELNSIFALMETGSAMKGLAARAGFMHLEQGSVQWFNPHSPNPCEEWIAWINTDDCEHLLAVSPERLCEILEPATNLSTDRPMMAAKSA